MPVALTPVCRSQSDRRFGRLLAGCQADPGRGRPRAGRQEACLSSSEQSDGTALTSPDPKMILVAHKSAVHRIRRRDEHLLAAGLEVQVAAVQPVIGHARSSWSAMAGLDRSRASCSSAAVTASTVSPRAGRRGGCSAGICGGIRERAGNAPCAQELDALQPQPQDCTVYLAPYRGR